MKKLNSKFQKHILLHFQVKNFLWTCIIAFHSLSSHGMGKKRLNLSCFASPLKYSGICTVETCESKLSLVSRAFTTKYSEAYDTYYEQHVVETVPNVSRGCTMTIPTL